MNQFVIPLLVLALGITVGWIVARRQTMVGERAMRERIEQESLARVEAEARLKSQEEMKAESELAFNAVATEALKTSTDQFLKLAKSQFDGAQQDGAAELDKRKTAIEELLKPLQQNLTELDKHTRALESTRQKAYGELTQQLEALATTTDRLNTSNTALTTALRGSSQARGRWGETALRNIVEWAGMTLHCDFEEQSQDQAGNRPDMIVRLPGDGRIPVDSKVPLKDYLEGSEATDPETRKVLFVAHAAALRGFVRELERKDYAKQQEGHVDFTVMFLPSEPALSAAFEHDPELQAYAMGRRILITTPVTLVALLRTVGIYWDQEKFKTNTQAIWDSAQELFKRVVDYQGHIDSVGANLKKTLTSYNKAMGTYSTRVLPTAKKMGKLGAAKSDAKPLPEPSEIADTVRTVTGKNPDPGRLFES